jgi:hypothetical protein
VKKILTSCVFAVSLMLVIATGVLMAFPIPAFAASCTAKCSNGTSVTCEGNRDCVATDGIGCVARNWGNTPPMQQNCNNQ